MSHTNQTPNYNLPQFIGTDKPAWLVDYNQSMSDIDTQMKANETASATAEANAQSALSGVSTLNSQVSGLQTDVTAIQTQMPIDEAQIATNTQNISTQASAIVNANNRIDTLNGKVGDLADLDTTDKTSVVNAINELTADIADLNRGEISVTADGVKTRSQLLNELHSLIDWTKLRPTSKLVQDREVFNLVALASTGSELIFTLSRAASTYLVLDNYTVSSASSCYESVLNGSSYTRTDDSGTVIPAGKIYKIVY